MRSVVVDASITLAWCFPDETSDYADSVLIALERHTILVPAIWSLEVSNAILVGELRKRLNRAETKSFVTLLESLFVVVDTAPATEHITNVLPLARTHGLTAWDASYLELSIRRNAPLATLDEKLQRAAKHAGVMLFEGKARN